MENTTLQSSSDVAVESESYGCFVIRGLKRAGVLFALLAALAGVGFLLCWRNVLFSVGWHLLAICGSVLSGPVPALLTHFDISDKTLYVLWGVSVVPYWIMLGAAAGLLRWATRSRSLPVVPGKVHEQIGSIIGIMAILLAVISYRSGPFAAMGPASVGPSLPARIMTNLRQIDGAKQQLALEKKLSSDYVPTEAELAPYLGRFFHPVGPERYVFNSIGKTPYAVLDTDWRIPRRRWRQGYTIPKQEYHLP